MRETDTIICKNKISETEKSVKMECDVDIEDCKRTIQTDSDVKDRRRTIQANSEIEDHRRIIQADSDLDLLQTVLKELNLHITVRNHVKFTQRAENV